MSNIEILKNRISQLLEEKDRGKRVDNELHDTAIKLSQLLLADKFPNRSWRDATKNKKGIDVRGYLDGKLDVACEVTTHDRLEGNRRIPILEDLRRLQDAGIQNKFLAIVHAEVLIQLKRMRSKELLRGVEVLDLPVQHFEKLSK